jgi:hypothetical protein
MALAINLIKNILPAITAIHDVVNRTRILNTQLAQHSAMNRSTSRKTKENRRLKD